MNKEKFLAKLKDLENENYISIYTKDNQYMIEDGSAFVGGIKGTYVSDILWYVYYEKIESIGDAMYNALGEKIVEVE